MKYFCILCTLLLISCATPQKPISTEVPEGTPNEQLIRKAARGTYAEGQNLLAKGADLNFRDQKGISVLHVATNFKNKDFVKFLLDNKVDINIVDVKGISPLSVAVHNKDLDLTQLLIDSGADVNYAPIPELSPIQTALMEDSIDIIRILIKAGVDVNEGYAHKNAFTCPLTLAKSDETRVFLLENGANPNFYLDAERDLPYLFMLIHSKLHSALSIALEHGANPNIQSKVNKTSPLHIAVLYKDIESVKILLQHGADKELFDLTLKKPIDIATELDLKEIIQLLQ